MLIYALCMFILVIIIVIETYVISKIFIYKPIGKNFNQVNSILYHFLTSSPDTMKTYKINNSFYVSTFNTSSLILIKMFIMDDVYNDVYLITDDIVSPKIYSFINNGYKYILDADGLWIDVRYKRPNKNEKIICVHWAETPIEINSNAKFISSSYCIDNTECGFTLLLKNLTDSKYIIYIYPYEINKVITNKISCKCKLSMRNLKDNLIFTNEIKDNGINCLF